MPALAALAPMASRTCLRRLHFKDFGNAEQIRAKKPLDNGTLCTFTAESALMAIRCDCHMVAFNRS